MRPLLLLLLSILAAGLPAQYTPAQKPAAPPDPIWPATQHDFGTVPHGAQLLHRFVWRNPTTARLEITDLRVSCGCVTATPNPRVLEPGQQGTLDVAIDCRRFVGEKTVTVQLLLSPGSRGVTLLVHALSRQDVVYNPGSFQFGVVAEGTTAEQTVDVEYAGSQPWKVEAVTSESNHLEARVTEIYRRTGQVGYRVHCQLKGSAPAGDFKSTLNLRTNDPVTPVLPIGVEALIRAAVVVTPNPVSFGTVRVGQKTQRRCTVRSDQPFSITRADAGANVQVLFASSPANVHTILIDWTPTQAGEQPPPVVLATSLEKSPSLRVNLIGQAR